jgi:hypothetical protein
MYYKGTKCLSLEIRLSDFPAHARKTHWSSLLFQAQIFVGLTLFIKEINYHGLDSWVLQAIHFGSRWRFCSPLLALTFRSVSYGNDRDSSPIKMQLRKCIGLTCLEESFSNADSVPLLLVCETMWNKLSVHLPLSRILVENVTNFIPVNVSWSSYIRAIQMSLASCSRTFATARSTLFLVVVQRMLVSVYRRFRTAYPSHIQGSRVNTAWPMKMGPIGCSLTSVTLRKNPEERGPHLHCGGSLEFCNCPDFELLTAAHFLHNLYRPHLSVWVL